MKTHHEWVYDGTDVGLHPTEDDFGVWLDTWRLDDFEDLVDGRAARRSHLAELDGGLEWPA